VGENTSQIEREIRAERTELGRNLRELETKARDYDGLAHTTIATIPACRWGWPSAADSCSVC
jgi:hypothetical protein